MTNFIKAYFEKREAEEEARARRFAESRNDFTYAAQHLAQIFVLPTEGKQEGEVSKYSTLPKELYSNFLKNEKKIVKAIAEGKAKYADFLNQDVEHFEAMKFSNLGNYKPSLEDYLKPAQGTKGVSKHTRHFYLADNDIMKPIAAVTLAGLLAFSAYQLKNVKLPASNSGIKDVKVMYEGKFIAPKSKINPCGPYTIDLIPGKDYVVSIDRVVEQPTPVPPVETPKPTPKATHTVKPHKTKTPKPTPVVEQPAAIPTPQEGPKHKRGDDEVAPDL